MPELAKAYEPQQVEDRLYVKWPGKRPLQGQPQVLKEALLDCHAAAERYGQADPRPRA